ncbi:dipeptide ABC transporter ATP-binding protein [Streptomyces sp. CWNU-1]|uniref:Dipeptide ABC transporter ATP-binding protein n=1 Tax=Streptomyces albipurpureus TaxID=2897419 RepID=A0ABT0UH55_9ACTN|nr:dipeptide ABC transporter ATP-binding protein [Streptomyces sp. CWNU-1]MCM2387768.1 dipeptide ABC transporter ATP-binding protein [Streptomyces sp. CWNU-1]
MKIPQQQQQQQPRSAPDALLRVDGLVKHFPIREGLLRRQTGAVQAVDGLTFDVRPGETLGVVGESGCGKSTMGRLITRLLEPTAGTIEFQGHDITHLGVSAMRPLRRDVQMIFQDPYSSLNPRHTIGTIVSAPFRLQGITPEGGVKKEVQRLLELVGLSPEHYNRYPHEFSGGQRQRIGIARALALKPKLVVADEPVSALDVSIQAQVVNLLDDLQDELGLTYLIIAHDLSVIRHVSDRIAVMYLGKIVELTDRLSLYQSPMHPYTKALLSAVPVPDPRRRGVKSDRILLKGDVPSPISPPRGCRFHTRCWKATEVCVQQEPPLVELKPGQQVACHHPENAADQVPDETVLESAREAVEIVSLAPKTEAGTVTGTEAGTGTVTGAEAGTVTGAEVGTVTGAEVGSETGTVTGTGAAGSAASAASSLAESAGEASRVREPGGQPAPEPRPAADDQPGPAGPAPSGGTT